MYTHSVIWSKDKKKVYTCKRQFYYIKVGCKGGLRYFVTRTYLCNVRISKNDPLLKNGVWPDSNQRNLDQNHQHSVYKLCLIQCSITIDIYIYMYSQTLSYKYII